MASKPSVHVVSSMKGRWSVRRSGGERATLTGFSRSDAWTIGKTLARADKVVAYLHDEQGQISARVDYRDKEDQS